MQENFKPRVRHLQGARFLVESRSQPGVGHQVDVLRLRCGCEAGKRGLRCWHLTTAIAFEDWRRRQQASFRAQGREEMPAPTQQETGMAALQAAFA